jgi:hypothetical protein
MKYSNSSISDGRGRAIPCSCGTADDRPPTTDHPAVTTPLRSGGRSSVVNRLPSHWRRRVEMIIAVVTSLAVAWFWHVTLEQRRLSDALVAAVIRRDSAAVEHWLRQGADENTRWDVSPLFGISHAKGTRAVLEILIDLKQDFRADRFSDHSVLFLAALRGDAAITRVLLRHGADVNMRCRNGKTPLTWARRGGNGAVIDLLKRAGAMEGSPDPPAPRQQPYWGGYAH